MVEVRLEQGVVLGNQRAGVFRFRGMPYAAPPLGELRWAPPAPPESWVGVRDATEFGHAAIQTADNGAELGAEPSEDCLTVNVWSPTLDAGARLPVMVWIHGGGFLNWSASMKLWHGSELARRGVVLVSFNYRLGAFGFFSHPQAGDNFAVQDWVAALTWVARNVHTFGGDPGNVTVFGQSAGGAAVRTLLGTPSARGLIHRAILQSGGCEHAAALPDVFRERVTLASAALCERVRGDDLDHLRGLPVEAVRQASRALSGRLSLPPPGQVYTPFNLVWYPTADGTVVADDLSCWDADVPVLFGSTEHEARFFITPTGPYGASHVDPARIYTPATVATMAKVLAGDRAEEILARLGGSPYEALAELYTSAVWSEPELKSYQRFTDMGRTAFAYRFSRVSPGNHRGGMLAHHCAELPYVFGHLDPEQTDEVDARIADAMQHAWTEFARTGVPRDPDGTLWPRTTADQPRHTVIGDTVHSAPLAASPVTTSIHALRAGVPA
jgi:para-nitrobenzyl esterase